VSNRRPWTLLRPARGVSEKETYPVPGTQQVSSGGRMHSPLANGQRRPKTFAASPARARL